MHRNWPCCNISSDEYLGYDFFKKLSFFVKKKCIFLYSRIVYWNFLLLNFDWEISFYNFTFQNIVSFLSNFAHDLKLQLRSQSKALCILSVK